jgi:hypothetical protein
VGAVTFGAENEGLTVFAVELTLEFVASSFISAGLSTVGNVPFENSFSGRDACLGASAAGPGSKSGGAAALIQILILILIQANLQPAPQASNPSELPPS